ncbi:hypothetical protein PR048_013925 [Dryococelus australis]|uniref:Uncharacterized protein n=1 Tax=Dryococelus australis TaxID=614101 RepID=A0ABQ9HU19_9NEOP|nr:hypothetical protein PR048_013925 [Dryococelus australis]
MAEGAGYNLPPKLSFNGNVHENCKRFKHNCEEYLGASGKDPDIMGKYEAVIKALRKMQSRALLNIAGEEAIYFAATLNLTEAQMDIYNDLVSAFDSYAAPKRNETYELYIFNQCYQDAGDTFDHFLTRAKTLVTSCGYGDQEQSLLRDSIVIGIREPKNREVLLCMEDLNLEQTACDCMAAERS